LEEQQSNVVGGAKSMIGGALWRNANKKKAAELYARLHGFENRVTSALKLIEKAMEKGIVGVSFSGGKDSTVLLDLVRRVCPDAPAAFFDSGCELRQTYDVIKHYRVEIIKPEMSLIEMCKHGGYWGYEHPMDAEATFDFGKVLIDEPAKEFIDRHHLAVVAMGLRIEESVARKINAKVRGTFYFAEYMNVWHLCPLQNWTTMDIWAYIVSRKLKYNEAYDVMDMLGIPIERQRISTILGIDASQYGRYVYLKKIDSDLWNRLAGEFPGIRKYT
jgi:phosphoadenosine phosphosulfate reductase